MLFFSDFEGFLGQFFKTGNFLELTILEMLTVIKLLLYLYNCLYYKIVKFFYS